MNLNHLFASVVSVGCLLGTVYLVGCQADHDTASTPRTANLPQTSGSLTELRFDERYRDSIVRIGPPYSERTKRERAILHALSRLEMAKSAMSEPIDPTSVSDSVHEHIGNSPLRSFPNEAAFLAHTYRQLDSLKILENIPLTPYPPIEAHEN